MKAEEKSTYDVIATEARIDSIRGYRARIILLLTRIERKGWPQPVSRHSWGRSDMQGQGHSQGRTQLWVVSSQHSASGKKCWPWMRTRGLCHSVHYTIFTILLHFSGKWLAFCFIQYSYALNNFLRLNIQKKTIGKTEQCFYAMTASERINSVDWNNVPELISELNRNK